MITENQFFDLSSLVEHPGWKVVEDYLQRQVRIIQSDLERKTFGSLAEVTLLQGRLQQAKAALAWPGTQLEQYIKPKED